MNSSRSRRAPLTHVLALGLAALSLTGVAAAQSQTSSAVAGFTGIDTDRDHKLDRRELTAAADRDFTLLDPDKDGYLTRDELKQTHSVKLLLPLPGRLNSASAFAAADTDHDQKIDKHEYETAIVSAYMSCDRNHDGTIELSDLRHCRL